MDEFAAPPQLHARYANANPNLFLPPSVSRMPRVYLDHFYKHTVDAFYDAVEKAYSVVFVEKPRQNGHVLYGNPIVIRPRTSLYRPVAHALPGGEEDGDDGPPPLRRTETDLRDVEDRYEYTVRYEIDHQHAGTLSIALYPTSPILQIQKEFSRFGIHRFHYEEARGASEHVRRSNSASVQASSLYPHLRMEAEDKFRLWLMLAPQVYMHRFHDHNDDYERMLARAVAVATRHGMERLNTEEYLGGMALAGGNTDALRLIQDAMFRSHAEERIGLA